LFTIIGVSRVLVLKTRAKAISKRKADLKLTYFVCAVRAVGKFKSALSRIRLDRAMRTMKLMVKPLTRWVEKRRKLLGNKIVVCVEWALTNEMMFKLMAAWRLKV
jgi:hypothetical protein